MVTKVTSDSTEAMRAAPGWVHKDGFDGTARATVGLLTCCSVPAPLDSRPPSACTLKSLVNLHHERMTMSDAVMRGRQHRLCALSALHAYAGIGCCAAGVDRGRLGSDQRRATCSLADVDAKPNHLRYHPITPR